MSNPEELYDPTPFYSQLVTVKTPAQFIFVAGQSGENKNRELSKDFTQQVEQAFENLKIALNTAGADFEHVAKMTILIVDYSVERLQIYAEEFNKRWGDLPKPACTLIPVPKLALDTMLFEIEAMAILKLKE